jgi:hypothetical protein
MTTAAEVRKMVQPVLDRHSDIALVGRHLFLKPIHHFARTILVGRTAYKDRIRPLWAVVHLFEARTFFPLTWGEDLANERSQRRGRWNTSQADIAAALVEAIEEQALPRLRALTTLDDYLAFVSQNFFRHHLFDWPQCKVIVDVALGDLDAARSLCRAHGPTWSVDNPEHDEYWRATFRRLRELCARLSVDDRSGLAQLLHQWEAETAVNLKIKHLWEPTPFPLELHLQGK